MHWELTDNHIRHYAGDVVVTLLCFLSVRCKAVQKVGIVRAGQYVAAIQGIFPDGVGEGRSGPVCRICAGVFPDGVGQALAGATFYVVVYGIS